MDVFNEIKKALDDGNQKAPILAFGGFRINKWLGEGEQGLVLRAQGPVGKDFAIKLCRPPRTKTSSTQGVRTFQREVKTLARLSHSNIVRVYTGGRANLGPTWTVREGFAHAPAADDIHYYVMDYIDRRLDDDDIFPELKNDLRDVPPPSVGPADTSLRQKAKLFEQLVLQLTAAMTYYHKQKITHKDIKPENVRHNTHDSAFVVVDFGFARHLGSKQDEHNVHKVRCIDWDAVGAEDYVRGDIGALAIMLRRILPCLAPIYQGWRYGGLVECIDRALSPQMKQRYASASDFCDHMRRFFVMFPPWNLTLALNEYLTPSQFGRFTAKLRIPVSGSILRTKEVSAIIDTPAFQRLRGTRQLGPTIFVFPGANHTRFEHSLGTYDLALKYLERVLRNPHGRHLDEQLEHSIKLVALSALLHDIGHYPYSHWVEEIDGFPGGATFPSHEQRARDILTTGTLSTLITKEWEMDPHEIANVISDVQLDSEPGLLANSFINSAVDVDKVDYLVRDSVHCGVDYGHGMDVERLFDSLYVDVDKARLCLTDKGLPSLLSLLTCRNIMYQAVYWHKTVRACEAMFKRFFYEFVGRRKLTAAAVSPYFELSDDAFTKALHDKCDGDKSLQPLMKPFVFGGRDIYKPAYIFSESESGDEPRDTLKYFSRVLSTGTYRQLVKMSHSLAKKLKKEIPDLQPLELLLERTPTKTQHTRYDLKALRVWHLRKRAYRSLPAEIKNVNEYLELNRQAYLFCHPRHYDRMVELAMGGHLGRILDTL